MAKQVQEEGGIRIKIRGLEDGSHPIQVKSSAEVLELPMFRRDLEIKGSLVKDHDRVTIDATVKSIADLECSRCTEPASFEVEAPMHIELVPPHLALPGIEEEDEIHVYDAFASPTFDMVQDVRDALGVAVPMKVLCKKNCFGLCPHCGTNWNHGTCNCEQPAAEAAWTSSLRDLQEKLKNREGDGS
jgi:uncharacterized protein